VKVVSILQNDQRRKRNTTAKVIELLSHNVLVWKGLRKDGTKYLMQYKWRCTFRDAYYVCCMIWPWSHTKLPKITKIIEHYTQRALKDNVISLDEYREVQKNVQKN